MGTIFYPPGWDGPVEPNGHVVGGQAAAPAAPAPSPAYGVPPAPPQPAHDVPPAPPQPAPPQPAYDVPPAPPQPAPPPPAYDVPPAPPQPAPPQSASPAYQNPPRGRRRPTLSAPSLPALRGKPLAVAAVVVAALLIAIAYNQNSNAKKWRSNEQVEASRNQTLTSSLTAANASVTTLSSQVNSLKGRVSHLSSQLSAAANAKEKALDQATVFKRVADDAGLVSDALSGCVNDMRGLIEEIAGDIANQSFDAELEQNASVAGDACARAQSANSELQSELSSVG